MTRASPPAVPNVLLAALPAADYKRLLPELESVELAFGEILHEQGAPITHVYFPEDSLVSLLTVVDGRSALEVGMVGREGMLGVACAMGATTTPFRTLVQGAGLATRIKVADFRREIALHGTLQRQVNLYTYTLLSQVSKTAACNRFHQLPERLARWLLMTRDRMQSDSFRLTHAFLGHMLGVRRVGVTRAAHSLRARGLIEYHRGAIDILDGRGLEAAACSCYEPSGASPDQWAATGGSKRAVSRRTTS